MADSTTHSRRAERTSRSAWRSLLAALGIAGLGSAPATGSAADGGFMRDVTFADASAAASSAELARRLLTPLAYRRVAPHLGDARAMPLDVAKERFAIYVPEGAPPPNGYALLVFVPPWSEAALPHDWPRILDKHGMIFVSAANSGNDADTLDRRIPLALLGYENIRRRYAVDANRVYVGGLSGGSRVALRVALAHPDLFRGALLNAGSDPVGSSNGLTIPPADLFRRFQDSTRLVFLTGERDEVNVHNDLVAAKSLREWCALDQALLTMPRRGHEIADAAGLERAVRELEGPSRKDVADVAGCRDMIEQKLAADVAAAEAAAVHGERERAVDAMNAIDARYGGLSADALVGIERKLESHD
jgi:pimeloyl-ACP methyl ester carboxylesterase